MSTKTISITKNAYDRLKILKKERESFSDVINRITKNKDLMDFYGVFAGKIGDNLEKAIKESREENKKLSEARYKRLEKEWGE